MCMICNRSRNLKYESGGRAVAVGWLSLARCAPPVSSLLCKAGWRSRARQPSTLVGLFCSCVVRGRGPTPRYFKIKLAFRPCTRHPTKKPAPKRQHSHSSSQMVIGQPSIPSSVQWSSISQSDGEDRGVFNV